MFRITPAIKNILIITFAIFLIDLYVLNGAINNILTLQFVLSEGFIFVQFFGYMWLHVDWGHIFSNMLILFFLGPMLEEYLGSKRFLQFYLIVGLGAGLLYGIFNFVQVYPDVLAANNYIENPSPQAFEDYIFNGTAEHIRVNNGPTLSKLLEAYKANPGDREVENATIKFVSEIYTAARQGYSAGMLGASGAVFGVLLALGMLMPEREIRIYFILPVKLKYVVFLLGMYTLYNQINQREGDLVSHLTHLTGMLVAFILLKIWKKKIS